MTARATQPARPRRPVTHRSAVRVILLDSGDRVLLMHFFDRLRDSMWWNTPGGGVDGAETDREAARREMREETGIEVGDLEGPLATHNRFFYGSEALVHQRERYYVARSATTEVDMSGVDEFEAKLMTGHRWWSLAEIESSVERIYPLGLVGLVRDFLRDGVPDRPIELRR